MNVTMPEEEPSIHELAAGFPEADETGNVDMTLIRHNLALTPAERLTRLEQFADFISTVRQLNPVPVCTDSETSSVD